MQGYDWVKIRQYFESALGEDTIKYLHTRNHYIDWLTLVALFTLFILFMYYLGNFSFSLMWVLFFILQGFLIQIINIYAHDNCTHYRLAGKYSKYIDRICCYIGFRIPSEYREFHLGHHRSLNTQDDPEQMIIEAMGKHTRLKRLLSFTIFILFMLPNNVVPYPKPVQQEIQYEKKMLWAFSVVLIILLIIFPKFIFFGYLLPFLLVTPFASMTRFLLEHTDIERGDSLQIATFYRTNWLTKLLFFYASGDCHLVHHIYPGIQYYRMTKAVKLFRPLLLTKGVREHRSLFKLYYQFIIELKPIRGSWSNKTKE